MSDVYYTRGRIIKAADQLVTASAPIKQRAWDAYHTLIVGEVHQGMESEYEELESIFNGIRYDQIEERLSESKAIRAASIMLELYGANAERHGRESVEGMTV